MTTRKLADGVKVRHYLCRGLNANDLIIGSSGSGKTFSYVTPNLLSPTESLIISDPKGTLYGPFRGYLEDCGYTVHKIDLTGAGESTIGFNPLDYIRDEERDIMRIATALIPDAFGDEPFWPLAARNLFTALMAYVWEIFKDTTTTAPSDVLALCDGIPDGRVHDLMQKHEKKNGDTFAVRKWSSFWVTSGSPKTAASIASIAANYLEAVTLKDSIALFKRPNRIDFKEFVDKQTAIFVTVSDTDRTMDPLISLFFTTAFQELIRMADDDVDGYLHREVRFYFDDFATNCVIPDFDRIISTIRSRNIAVSVILQTLAQLESCYGPDKAKTIANGCDHIVYFGGTDVETASYIARLTDRPVNDILHLPEEKVWVISNGEEPLCVKRYNVRQDELWDKYEAACRGIRKVENRPPSSVRSLLESAVPLLLIDKDD